MRLLFAISVLLTAVKGLVDYGDVFPELYASGKAITIDAETPYADNQTIQLTHESPILTLDYGTEVAGFPFFDVVELSGPTQIEVKYAEDFTAFENPNVDGPWTFSNGLSNTFRVEAFNLTKPGRVESYFVQGGQRWETVRLLTNTTVSFRNIGHRSTSQHTPADDVPGSFSASNPLYNRIWDLGARVVQVACVDAGNAPSTWDITPDGAFIRGQQTAASAKGLSFANYTMSFSTKINRGGTGWRVAGSTTPTGALFYLTSNYPADTTYLDTNRTLLPPNTLVFNYGYSIENQTTLQTGWNQYFPVNMTVEENVWYNISTALTSEGYKVLINDVEEVLVPIAEAAFLAATTTSFTSSGGGDPLAGTWGFGPWNGQEAYFKDVKVTAQNGTLLYTNPMTSDATLAEYGVAPLDASVCLDGAKRDRLVWAGDFYHTGKVIGASTARFDYIIDTIEYVFSYQMQSGPTKGFVPISASLGTRPEYKDTLTYAGLIDYQDLFLSSIGNYYWTTGAVEKLKPFWSNIKALVDARMAFIDPKSGLVAGEIGGEPAFYFLGPVNGSAITALFSYSLQRLIPLATALNDSTAATQYNQTSQSLNSALNSKLWNPSLGTYSLSLSAPSNYSLTSIAWTILSNAANTTQAASMIAKLPSLRLGVGYKTSSSDADSDTTQLSPNILGMLLEALFIAHRDLGVKNTTIAESLLDDFWSRMVTQKEYYSGASWEYLYADGSPGIDLFTSLAHPWGTAPTYVLPEYVLGVRATSPGFETWEFRPLIGIFGLTEVHGTVVTPKGRIEARWEVVDGGKGAVVTVSGPVGTRGRVVLPENVEGRCDGRKIEGRYLDIDSTGVKKVEVHNWIR